MLDFIIKVRVVECIGWGLRKFWLGQPVRFSCGHDMIIRVVADLLITVSLSDGTSLGGPTTRTLVVVIDVFNSDDKDQTWETGKPGERSRHI